MLSVAHRKSTYTPPRKPRKGKPVSEIMAAYAGIEDQPKKRRPSTVGIRSRLGIMQFVANLFEVNELLPRSKKHTDTALLKIIQDEFPDRPAARRKIKISPIANYRYKFNTGTLTGQPPAQISFRYNSLGQVVDQRTGNRLLSLEEKQSLFDKFRKKSRYYQQCRADALAKRRNDYAESHPTDDHPP